MRKVKGISYDDEFHQHIIDYMDSTGNASKYILELVVTDMQKDNIISNLDVQKLIIEVFDNYIQQNLQTIIKSEVHKYVVKDIYNIVSDCFDNYTKNISLKINLNK